MIGTGSTGIQAAPVIAAAATHLTVFQRTANYSVPARNAPLVPEFRQYIKDHADDIRAVTRETLNGMGFRIEERLAVETPPEEREKIYEAAWERGGLQFRAVFQDMLVDINANDTAADFIKRKIRSIVKDPKTAAILSNIDHPTGGIRVAKQAIARGRSVIERLDRLGSKAVVLVALALGLVFVDATCYAVLHTLPSNRLALTPAFGDMLRGLGGGD
jgi:cation diffusion facilitator CzcD-associated flavoprotein CzcO